MKKLIKWININIEAAFGAIVFFGMLGIITMQIFMRNVLGAGTAWGEEICRFCYVWVCYIGLGYATRNNIHIKIDVVQRKLPIKVQKVMVIILQMMMLYVFCRFFYNTLITVIRVADTNARAESLNISQNWMYVAGPIGYGFGVVRAVQTLIWEIRHFGSSWELFINEEGVFSGTLDTFCYPKEVKEEMIACLNPDTVREAEEFEAARKRKRRRAE